MILKDSTQKLKIENLSWRKEKLIYETDQLISDMFEGKRTSIESNVRNKRPSDFDVKCGKLFNRNRRIRK